MGRAPLINPAGYGMRLGQGDIALIEIIEGKITPEYADEEGSDQAQQATGA